MEKENIEPPMKRKKLGQGLFKSLETQTLVDIDFLIGPQKIKIPAHKNVLATMSDVFAAKLCNTNWDDRDTIEIPQHIGETAFRHFLKFIYTEELEFTNVDLSALFELTELADMYLMKNFMTECEIEMKARISFKNCVEIYQETKALSASSSISDFAFDYLKRNIDKVLLEVDPKDWCYEGLLELLQSIYLIVEEIRLFRLVLQYIENNEISEQELQKLTDSIRFPLISVDTLANEVVPTRVLSDNDFLNLFVYLNGGRKTPIRFKEEPRRMLIALSAKELHQFINNSSSGDIIQLEDLEYRGNFVIPMEKSGLTIRGGGDQTILTSNDVSKSVIKNNAENFSMASCSIHFEIMGIDSSSSKCTFTKLNLHQIACNAPLNSLLDMKSMNIKGNDNTVHNVNFHSNNIERKGYASLHLNGDSNTCTNCEFNAWNNGLFLHGSNSKLQSIICLNRSKISIHGLLQVLDGLEMRSSAGKERVQQKLSIRAKSSIFKNIKLNASVSSHVSYILIHKKSIDCDVQNCIVDRTIVDGKRHKLGNVSSKYFIISGSGHKFTGCQSDNVNFESREDMSLDGCNFV